MNNSSSDYIRLSDVMRRTGLARSTIYAAIARGKFPPPVKIGQRVSVWPVDEIDDFLGARRQERDSRLKEMTSISSTEDE